MSLTPLHRPPGRDIGPSTHPQTHPGSAGRSLDHSIIRSAVTWEAENDEHTSCITISHISFVHVMQDWGYLAPNKQNVEGWKRTNPSKAKNVVTYLIYYIDKGLSVATLEIINHLNRFPVREYCLDKRGEFIVWNGTADQPSPCLLVGANRDGWIEGIVCM